MTTARSPLHLLRAQARLGAAEIKRLKPNGKPCCKTAIAMDDKLITVEVAWDDIAKLEVNELAEYLLSFMVVDPTADPEQPPFRKMH